jgi:hypothetical protein
MISSFWLFFSDENWNLKLPSSEIILSMIRQCTYLFFFSLTHHLGLTCGIKWEIKMRNCENFCWNWMWIKCFTFRACLGSWMGVGLWKFGGYPLEFCVNLRKMLVFSLKTSIIQVEADKIEWASFSASYIQSYVPQPSEIIL